MTSAKPSVARPLDAVAIAVVLVLCLSWGFNQVSVKLSLPDIPPFLQGAIRSAGAAVLVAAWCWIRGIRLFVPDGSLRPGLSAGFLFGVEFLFLYPALLFTTASRAVVFLYLAPFFVVLGARWFLPADRFTASQWAGLPLSFAGMLLAFGLPTPAADPRQIIGDIMMVAAAACWAATTLVIKATALNRTPFEKAMLYQLVVSTPMLALAALVFGERIAGMPSPVAVGAMIYQTLWVVPVTFVAWFALIQRYSASRLSAFTFLTPIFGVMAGHLVLGEPLTPALAAAGALVAAGLVLVNRPR
ncbi:MAG TPA: DMT family transporter [Xanthobacteraceae bacterium]|nr:DMT family transporter [Xanthobacteraceae bacterium]